MHVTIKWKKCFTRQKTAGTKRRLCKISVQPHTLIILCIHFCSKKTKGRTILNLCKRTAKFIDKLKPFKCSLTNRELKKQIFSNLEHTNQIAQATEIPLRVIIFPAITISDITIFESLPSNGTVTVFRTIRPEFCPPFRSQTLKKALLSLYEALKG